MKEILCRDLDTLGVRAGDLLMIHASLRKLGLGRAAVGEGGPEMLLAALDAALGEDYFALILKAYLTRGRHRAGLVGEARSELLDAADLVAFGARWMEQNLTPRR